MLSKCCEEEDWGRRAGEKQGAPACKKLQPSPTARFRLPRYHSAMLSPALQGAARLWPVSQPWTPPPISPWPSCPQKQKASPHAGCRSHHMLLTPTVSVPAVLGHGGLGTGGGEALSLRWLFSRAAGCWRWEALCPPLGAVRSGSEDVAVALVGRSGEEKGGESG